MQYELPLQNEILDFVLRAPKSMKFDGCRMIDYSRVRHQWLDEISQGDINQRINRRAGLCTERPFYAKNAVFASVRRNRRKRVMQQSRAMYFA